MPSILLRGFSTSVTGTLAEGVFGGGPNSTIGNGGLRSDLDLQGLWQFDNLGFGNPAKVHQRQAENRLAGVDLFPIPVRETAQRTPPSSPAPTPPPPPYPP